MIELKWKWTGWSGGPGYTTIHCIGTSPEEADSAASDFDALFAGMVSLVPTGLNIRSTGVYRLMSETTGDLSSEGSLTSLPANHAGTGSAAFAASTGMCIDWLTGSAGPSRLRTGRTYLVPLTAFIYDANGNISDSIVTSLSGVAASVQSAMAGVLGVWKRPKLGAGGLLVPVTGSKVPDLAVVLRSRR